MSTVLATVAFLLLLDTSLPSQGGTVRKIGEFHSCLSALTSNNQFIIKLVKMWPGRTPHVVVGTLKISLDVVSVAVSSA